MQSIPTLNEFLNDERREVRETWDNSQPKRQNLKRRTRGSTSIRLLVGFYFICRRFTPEDPAPALPSSPFDRRPVQEARVTQTPTFRLLLLLKPSSIRLFPCSSDTGPSSPCVVSALRPRSTLLQPYSRRMQSALPSSNMRSLLSLARCRTPIPSRRCSRSRSLKMRERKKWCVTKRRRLLVELPRTRSCRVAKVGR